MLILMARASPTRNGSYGIIASHAAGVSVQRDRNTSARKCNASATQLQRYRTELQRNRMQLQHERDESGTEVRRNRDINATEVEQAGH
jgi:hypothetical protein